MRLNRTKKQLRPGCYQGVTGAPCGEACNSWSLVSKRSPAEKAAQRDAAKTAAMSSKPPTAPQLAYLHALGDRQAPPGTMLEAAARISALVAAKGVRI